MKDDQYKRIAADIRRSVQEGRKVTGALRFFWSDLGPLIDSRYVTLRQIARDIGVNEATVQAGVHRIRREQKGLPSPARRSTRQPDEASEPDQSGKPAPEPIQQPEKPEPGAPKRIGNLVLKDPPEHQPSVVADEDGFFTLENGVRYRPSPISNYFFEVHPPNGGQPFETDRRPLPTDDPNP